MVFSFLAATVVAAVLVAETWPPRISVGSAALVSLRESGIGFPVFTGVVEIAKVGSRPASRRIFCSLEGLSSFCMFGSIGPDEEEEEYARAMFDGLAGKEDLMLRELMAGRNENVVGLRKPVFTALKDGCTSKL